jgi:hypothetical protein
MAGPRLFTEVCSLESARKTMKRRNRSILCIVAPSIVVAAAAVTACFQGYDPTSASGGPVATSGADSGGGNQQTLACTTGEVCSDPNPTQCTLDSPECFYLCGSPLCALGNDPANPDAGAPIPQAADVPPIFLGQGSVPGGGFLDGATTADPCVQVLANSEAIRQRSCAPCHQATSAGASVACGCKLNSILDDTTIANVTSPDFTVDGGAPATYVIPGNPAGSLLYQRIAAGQMPPPGATALLGNEAGAALVYPTASDLSVLYAWIYSCVQGSGDGGAYASSYYGGGVNGSTCFGPCGSGGDGGASSDAH